MRIFASLPSQQEIVIPNYTPFVEKLMGGVDTVGGSYHWFTPYLSSDWPEITGVTKKYFFIYSTDHEPYGGAWGEGDNLDLSDFVEKGKISKTGAGSDETYFLYRVAKADCGDDYEVHLSYHPVALPQQTRAYACKGGSLTEIGSADGTNAATGWVFRGIILPVLDAVSNPNGYDENHTGYAKITKMPNGTYEAKHVTVGGTPLTVKFAYSSSLNGRDFTRGSEISNYLEGLPAETNAQLSDGFYFEKNGRHYMITLANPHDAAGGGTGYDSERIPYIASTDANHRNVEFIKILTTELARTSGYYIEGNTLHHYCTNPDKTKLTYSTLDISKL